MALRTVEQILEFERLSDPKIDEYGMIYKRVDELLTCKICHTIGILRADGGVAPQKQLAKFRVVHQQTNGNISAALIKSGLRQCDCRVRAAEWMMVFERHARRQLADTIIVAK